MKKLPVFHMLFEQSGTFRDAVANYGHEAYDYDIQNEYGKTDFQIDLFREIEIAFYNLTLDARNEDFRRKTIFDNMKPETDFIIAFFPCTYFSEMNELLFRGFQRQGKGEIKQHRAQKDIKKIIERNKQRSYFFDVWLKFCFVCQELGIPTIIENPCGSFGRNFLTLYSPWGVSYTDKDRSKFGDKFKKPTYYFAINYELKENFQMFEVCSKLSTVHGTRGKERSEIAPRYANNFYKRFLEQAIKEGLEK